MGQMCFLPIQNPHLQAQEGRGQSRDSCEEVTVVPYSSQLLVVAAVLGSVACRHVVPFLLPPSLIFL